jgi:hypothetical protein
VKNQKSKISSTATKLQELSLPYLEVILEEIFLMPPAFLGGERLDEGATIGDLVAYSGIKEDEVKRRLRQLVSWSAGIMLSVERVKQLHVADPNDVVVLDIRNDISSADRMLDCAVPLRAEDFESLFCECKAANKTLVILAESSSRAFSAALYCKEQGLDKVFALQSQRES